jgi:K(+)-stimulated pyrophosphate-energized sodium pump
MLLPIALAVVGILCSVIGTFFIRTGEKATQRELLKTLRTGTYFAAGLAAVGAVPITYYIMRDIPGVNWWGICWPFLRPCRGCAIGYITEYYTSDTYKPTKRLAAATETGAATTIIGGVSLGMLSTAAPIVIIAVAVIVSFVAAGGTWTHRAVRTRCPSKRTVRHRIAAVGMLRRSHHAGYRRLRAVADNAGGIAEMSGLGHQCASAPTPSTRWATRRPPPARASPSARPR